MYDIYDTLFREEADGSYVPNLCTEYSFNEDGTELTMKLVEGVKFQNGDVMTVDDVVFSLNTSIASSFTTKFTSSMKEAVKVDDNTVKLVLKYAYAPVIGSLVNATTSIVPKRVYEADPEGFAQNPVGSGPYMLKEVVKGEKYVFEAFPDYFRGEASIKNMICRVIPDNNAALMALESGELDVMQPNQDYSDRQAIEDNPNLEYYTAPQACTFLIAFNNAKGIFSDKRMREAVAIAIDKEEIALGATNGYATPTEAGITPLCPQAPKDFKGLERDVERASWFDLCYTGGDYEISIYANAVQVLDADFGAYPFLHSSELNGGNNYMAINNPELDELLDKARISDDEPEREKLYLRVCEIIRDESLFVPMYTGERTYAAVKELKGVKADPMMRYYTYNYSWE